MTTLPALRTDDDRRQHPYCQECKAQCEASNKDWNKVVQQCKGVYGEEDYEVIAARAGVNTSLVRELMDPTEWIHRNLAVVPYWYQDRAIKCTSTRIMFRWGRRTGKTQIVAANLVRLSIINENYKILAITPMKSQAKEIFDRILDFFSGNEDLRAEAKTKQQPYYEINFKNGSRIRIFVAGTSAGANAATQVRGQEADFIFIDEMDYLDDDASKAIMPVLSDPERRGEPIKFIGSSTPSGKEGKFFELCIDEFYKEFHVPSSFRPDWNDRMESECRKLAKTEQNYQHEFEAAWGTKSDGVFRRNDIIRSLQDYRYLNYNGSYEEKDWPQLAPWPHWTYMIGVDWNGGGTGTRIVIVGFDPARAKWIVTYREKIDIADYALHVAVDRIVQLNRKWQPHSIYIDAGFGQMQDEYLRGIGRAAEIARLNGREYDPADLNLTTNLKAIDFGSWMEYEILDPITNKKSIIKKRIKNYIVENAQRHFELDDVWISKADVDLKAQLMGYAAARQDNHGFIIYKPDDEAGDHDLDAFMLALFAFNQEFDTFFRKDFDNRIIISKRPGPLAPAMEEEKPPDRFEEPVAYQRYIEEQKTKSKRRHHSVESREIPESKINGLPGMVFMPRSSGPRATGSIPNRNKWLADVRRRGNGIR